MVIVVLGPLISYQHVASSRQSESFISSGECGSKEGFSALKHVQVV